jgi:hypothetical protein
MTKRPITNVAASVRDRLLSHSRKTGEDFGFLLQRYAAERLLYRLGRSAHRGRFVLMLHLAQVVRNGLGDRSGTCIDPKMQAVQGKSVCVVTCQRSPEPVFLKWKGIEGAPEGDFFVRSGPGTVRLPPDSAKEYIRTRFPAAIARASVPHSENSSTAAP